MSITLVDEVKSIMNSLFTAKILDLTSSGHGVTKHPSGKVFLVRGLWPGQMAEFEVSDEQLESPKLSFAKVHQIKTISPHFVTPECAHHGFEKGQCGGCPWMMTAYPEQLLAKERRVKRALGLSECLPIQAAPEIWGYRNRAQLKTDGFQLGYVSAASQTLAPITNCPVLSPKLQKLLKKLHKRLPNSAWTPPVTKPWLSLDIDESVAVEEVSPNAPTQFQQGNTSQNQFMRAWLAQKVKNESLQNVVLELFAGDGNFTELLSEHGFEKVWAIESDGRSLFDLKRKGFRGVSALKADLYKPDVYEKLKRKHEMQPTILVMDPPRVGLKRAENLLATFPTIESVYSISCDPESLAKDLKAFSAKGFELTEVQPVDLFPHTPHVEVLCVLKNLA